MHTEKANSIDSMDAQIIRAPKYVRLFANIKTFIKKLLKLSK